MKNSATSDFNCGFRCGVNAVLTVQNINDSMGLISKVNAYLKIDF